MAKQQETHIPMEFEDSESEAFLPKPISSVLGRRSRIFEKFALLGWVFAFILFAHSFYVWALPRKPTDLECTKQLSAWCK
jgi:hypothetical protein